MFVWGCPWSSRGRRSCDRPQSESWSSPCRGPAPAVARFLDSPDRCPGVGSLEWRCGLALCLEWPCLAGHNRGGADCAADCPDRSSGLQIRILTIVLARTGVDEVCNALNRKAVGQARPGRRKIIPRRAWRRRHRAPLALSSHRVRPPGPYRACRRRPCRRALPRLCAPARRH